MQTRKLWQESKFSHVNDSTVENVSQERAYLHERKNAVKSRKKKRETMEIRKQEREEKEGKNVVSRTEVVVRDKNVTCGP